MLKLYFLWIPSHLHYKEQDFKVWEFGFSVTKAGRISKASNFKTTVVPKYHIDISYRFWLSEESALLVPLLEVPTLIFLIRCAPSNKVLWNNLILKAERKGGLIHKALLWAALGAVQVRWESNTGAGKEPRGRGCFTNHSLENFSTWSFNF